MKKDLGNYLRCGGESKGERRKTRQGSERRKRGEQKSRGEGGEEKERHNEIIPADFSRPTPP